MPASFITGEPRRIYDLDVAGGASVSESIGAKLGASINYLVDNFERYEFGISGATFYTLAMPYIFDENREVFRTNTELVHIYVYIGTTGTVGQTTFRLEWQPAAGGSWNSIFSADPYIGHNVPDDYRYDMFVGGSGNIFNPTITKTTFDEGDKLRFVLVGAADNASLLNILIIGRPIV